MDALFPFLTFHFVEHNKNDLSRLEDIGVPQAMNEEDDCGLRMLLNMEFIALGVNGFWSNKDLEGARWWLIDGIRH